MLKASCRFFQCNFHEIPLSTPVGGVGFPLLNNTALHFCCLHTITHTHNNVTHFHALCLIGAFRKEARFKYARARASYRSFLRAAFFFFSGCTLFLDRPPSFGLWSKGKKKKGKKSEKVFGKSFEGF